MRFTRYTDYALRVLIYLGLKPAGELSTIREIADRYGISENHLMKVVHHLGRHGFITTQRGRQGGMTLAKAPADIRLGDVVVKCEDDLRLVECFDRESNTCPIAGGCALSGVIADALAAFMDVLDRHTLADLLQPRAFLLDQLSPPVAAPAPHDDRTAT